MDDPVIRLWHRVGTIRAVFALVILAGLVGGLAIAALQSQDDSPSPDTVKAADAAAFPVSSSSATPTVSRSPNSLAEADALAKAQAAAEEASAQAKAADDEARKKAEEEASRSKTRSPSATPPSNSPPKYPVPASCDVYSGNKKTGCAVLIGMGFGLDQMPCLANLWDKESGWNPKAANPSGAYGIPQALPGSKMASAGADWKTNPETQIRWGLGYIKGKYKNPCGAWSYWQSHHSY
ncbi:transglycosylase SLT domain-containing protein [Dactylosporangium sp. NPDC051541]|uniref:aggregation-promoting factor C-terminal-like domain-containing protein n=1 Tax=Dactylosporangium sp. NPDC051541 TaxID=3363977 RepID=UPI0037BB4221